MLLFLALLISPLIVFFSSYLISLSESRIKNLISQRPLDSSINDILVADLNRLIEKQPLYKNEKYKVRLSTNNFIDFIDIEKGLISLKSGRNAEELQDRLLLAYRIMNRGDYPLMYFLTSLLCFSAVISTLVSSGSAIAAIKSLIIWLVISLIVRFTHMLVIF